MMTRGGSKKPQNSDVTIYGYPQPRPDKQRFHCFFRGNNLGVVPTEVRGGANYREQSITGAGGAQTMRAKKG